MSTLRERIAALQQRSTSPSAPSQAPSAKYLGLATNEGRSLKDRIATFEKRGGIPIPRSSFGLAPPSMDKASSREMYGNRFASTPMPSDPSMSRSNSVHSISPNPNPKRERRVSSYGDSGWSGGQLAHKRSYSTAGDKLIPMHTGTTSSDEVSSITSSFPATPHDTSTSFLKLNETFKEDPEDYNEITSSIPEDTPSAFGRDLPSTSPEVFRSAFDKFSSVENGKVSPIHVRKKSVPLIPAVSVSTISDNQGSENSLPDIVVNELSCEYSGTAPVTIQDAMESLIPMQPPCELPPSTFPETCKPTPAMTPKWDEAYELNRGIVGSAFIHDRTKAPSRTPSPCPSPVVDDMCSLSLKTQQEHSPKMVPSLQPHGVPVISTSTIPSSPSATLHIKKSQQPLCKPSPVKPPERPIETGLSTSDIMAQFPAVPFSDALPSANPNPKISNTTDPPIVSLDAIAMPTAPFFGTTRATANFIANNKPTNTPIIMTPPAPSAPGTKSKSKANPKSSIPGWWDYNSEDEDIGGWATVIVSTHRY